MNLDLPFKHEPRDYMLPFWKALDEGKVKRFGLVLPRRAGKTVTSVNATFRDMFLNVGSKFHYFPEYKQGKKIVWNGMAYGKNKEPMYMLDFMPKHLVHGRNNQEMILTTKHPVYPSDPGSSYSIMGSDKIDRSVGTNPNWILFDEYSLSDPMAWNYMRPVLAENGGYAFFIFTPRGRNHAHRLYQNTKDDPEWFWMKLTVDETQHIDKKTLERERKEIIAQNGDDAIFYQEYYTDFDVAIQGSIYGPHMRRLEEEGRIREGLFDPYLPVHTSWDLGQGDSTVVWFVQLDHAGNYRIIDHYKNRQRDFVHYMQKLRELEREKEYMYGNHYIPHDGRARTIVSSESVEDIFCKFYDSRTIHVVPRIKKKYDRIEIVRKAFQHCHFEKDTTEAGRDALNSYRYEWNEKRSEFMDEPVHDWASDDADAFGQIFQFMETKKRRNILVTGVDLDPYYQ